MPHLKKLLLNSPSLFRRLREIRLLVFDFDGVLTDNSVFVSQDGKEMVRCSREDGLGLMRLRNIGLETLIISTEENPVVSARAKKLNVPCVQGVKDKVAVLKEIVRRKKLKMGQVLFLGNDVNDLDLLSQVGWPVVVNDAHDEVKNAKFYQTQKKGGHGAVREVCDILWKAHNI